MDWNLEIPLIGNLINIAFHLLILYLAIYSALIVFSLVRYGQDKMVGLTVFLGYFFVLATLYFHAASLIAKL